MEKKNGYKIEKEEEFIHRKRAYHIYLENRNKYPLPYGAYEVHHIDFDKNNNKVSNLQILTPTEHDKIHEEKDKKVMSIIANLTIDPECCNKLKEIAKKDFNLFKRVVSCCYSSPYKSTLYEILKNPEEELKKRGFTELPNNRFKDSIGKEVDF